MTTFLPGAAAAALLLLVPPSLAAQDQLPEKTESPWAGSVHANGTSFFGTSDQRVLGGRGTLARADSVLELEARAEILYGDAEIAAQDRQVVKRSLLGSVSADYRPGAALSPFVFATIESNLEKRIDTRYSIGIGAKRTFIRTPQTESSLSLGLLDELTVPRPIDEVVPSTRLTRWSLRGRLRHAFDERFRLTHVTFWQPSVRTAAQYLVRSTSEAEYALNSVLAVGTSMLVNYDSEATLRGAPVNHDGQVLFGITARW